MVHSSFIKSCRAVIISHLAMFMEGIQNNKLISRKITYIDIYGFHIYKGARRAGSDGSMSASGQRVWGSIPGGVVNFNLKIFNLGARRGGDVHFLITRL